MLISFNGFSQDTAYLTNYNPFTNNSHLITNFSYRGITLGMIKSNVERVVEEDEFLEVDDTSYLGLFDKEKPFVLKVVSPPYVRSMYLIFEKDVLFNMVINFNQTIYSYSELLKRAKVRYGMPTDEYPDFAVWRFGDYELRVEKPAVVKVLITSGVSNVVMRAYESSKKIRERMEYSRRELLPF